MIHSWFFAPKLIFGWRIHLWCLFVMSFNIFRRSRVVACEHAFLSLDFLWHHAGVKILIFRVRTHDFRIPRKILIRDDSLNKNKHPHPTPSKYATHATGLWRVPLNVWFVHRKCIGFILTSVSVFSNKFACFFIRNWLPLLSPLIFSWS